MHQGVSCRRPGEAFHNDGCFQNVGERHAAIHVRRLVKQIRMFLIELGHDRSLTAGKPQRFPSHLPAMANVMDVGKFGKDDVRPAISRHNVPERNIRHPIHGRQPDDGSWHVMPEIHALSR